jgi:hypothetical protein
VEAAIRGMKDGTINPEDVKVAGIESEEEKAEAEVAEQNYSFFFVCIVLNVKYLLKPCLLSY